MPTRTSILIALLITLFPNHSKAQTTGIINGHEYVDLGLSVLWATTNVGADDISDIGKYNMWTNWREATSESGDNDVSAKAEWQDPWRLPTVDEVIELINQCSWQLEKTIAQKYDIIRVTGPNGNYINLIADVSGKDKECSYWTGTKKFFASDFFTLTIMYNDELSQFSSEISSCDFMSGCLTRPVVDKSAAATQKATIPTFTEEDLSQPSGTINGYDYVDMGCGVKWGTSNVGADRPSDFGSCFAWGEINTKSGYTQKNSLTRKKKSVDGYSLKNIAGNASLDAATAQRGKSWRLPTEEEALVLIRQCTWKWGTFNHRSGYLITSKINGNTIFLPAAGNMSSNNQIRSSLNEIGEYWTSSLGDEGTEKAGTLMFIKTGKGISTEYRHYGLPIRPVVAE